MKKPILIIFTLVLTNVSAQVTNAGFESAYIGTLCSSSGPTYTVPLGYKSTNNTIAITNVSHSGNKAAMIASSGGVAEKLITYDCSTFQYNIAYSGANPNSFTAWVRRAASVTNDTLTITAQTFNSGGTLLYDGTLKLTGAGYTAYTQVTVPMNFDAAGTATKVLLAFQGSTAANSSWYIDDIALSVVGIENFTSGNFSLFYNATTSNIEVTATQSAEESVSVSIYDIVGKKIVETPWNQLLNNASLSISTNGLQQGIYLVQVQNKKGPVTTKRIFIQ